MSDAAAISVAGLRRDYGDRVALDGVSLTVTTVGEGDFGIALIPHTLAVTTFGRRDAGDRVNIEVDYLAKVVHRLAVPYATATGGAR